MTVICPWWQQSPQFMSSDPLRRNLVMCQVSWYHHLNNPSWNVALQNIMNTRVPVNEEALNWCKDAAVWQMPGIVTHLGTWLGSWFFAKKPGSDNKLTVDCQSTSRPKVMCAGATLKAWMKDRRRAIAIASRKHIFSVHRFNSMFALVGLAPADANGGLIKANNTKCKSHWGIVRLVTGLASLIPCNNILTLGSVAGSYFQWRRTAATEVWWEIMVEGAMTSSNNSTKYRQKSWLPTWKTWVFFRWQNSTNLCQCDS